MKTVRLYGFTRGFGSYAQVTRGFEEGLRGLNFDDTNLAMVSLDSGDRDDEEPRLQLAHEAILTGPPPAWPVLFQNAQHAERSVMLAPNSDSVPDDLMRSLEKAATRILVPSHWALEVLAARTKLPVHIVSHGVSREFSAQARDVEGLTAAHNDGEFRVLHLTSTTGQRKGTVELIRAWNQAIAQKMIPPKAKLVVVATPEAKLPLVLESGLVGDAVMLFDRVNGSPLMMNSIYGRMHAVCQPSRAEGFGLVPLEARAAGCPVIATGCTGHSEHMGGQDWEPDQRAKKMKEMGVVVVAHGAYTFIDDLPGACAPSVKEEDILPALRTAYDEWSSLNASAMKHSTMVSKEWTWTRRLAIAGLW
jgi:hypothetical protein